MNISAPFAANSATIDERAINAFAKVWHSGHPATPWAHQMKLTGMSSHMSEYLNEAFFGFCRDECTHTFRTFAGDAYDMYMRLYSLFIDAFIVRGKRQFMPQIVVFEDADPHAIRALRYIESLGRVRVVIYHHLPFEPIDKQKMRAIIRANTVMVSAPMVNGYGLRLTDVHALDALTRDCFKTPLHVDLSLAYAIDKNKSYDAAPITSCDMSISAFPFTYVIGIHTAHIIDQKSYQMHAFMDLAENHCSAVATCMQMTADKSKIAAVPFDVAGFLTDVRLKIPSAYIATAEATYRAGWPSMHSGLVVFVSDSVLAFVVRVGPNIMKARRLQEKLLERGEYMHIVNASVNTRDSDDAFDMKKMMAQMCVISRHSHLLLDSLASLLCDSSQARLLCE